MPLNRDAISEKLIRAFCTLENRLFDLCNGIDTGSTPSEWECHQFGHGYQPVWIRNVRQLINTAFQLGEQPVDFIDIGCGKGKACFYAAKTGKFRNVLGIEISEVLKEKALLNLQSFHNSNVQFIQADATKYTLPPVKSLLFMFNPFGADIMERFLQLNRTVIRDSGSLLAYANDVERAVIEENGFTCIYRDDKRKISLWQYTAAENIQEEQ